MKDIVNLKRMIDDTEITLEELSVNTGIAKNRLRFALYPTKLDDLEVQVIWKVLREKMHQKLISSVKRDIMSIAAQSEKVNKKLSIDRLMLICIELGHEKEILKEAIKEFKDEFKSKITKVSNE